MYIYEKCYSMSFAKTCLLLTIFMVINSQLMYTSQLHYASTDLIKPPSLKKGDTIAIVTPAGYLKDDDAIDKGIELMKSWGLNVVVGAHVFDKHNYFAGTDEDRASDFQWAMDTPSIKAIWCARGGYGTIRIMEFLNFSTFLKNQKWIVGYSDITVLHSAFHNLGIETIHGIMASSNSSFENTKAVESLQNALFGKKISYKIKSSKQNRKGNATGELVGGNLSMLASLLGTPYALDTKNKILFIEDIGEHLYRLDRMIMSLKYNGYLENCKGIIVGGSITDIPENSTPFGMTIEEIVKDIIGAKNIPIIFDFPAGHFAENLALQLGSKVNIKVTQNKSKIEFLK